MSRWLSHFGLREAPFTKEIADGELWVPSSRKATVETLVETCRDRGDAVLAGEPGVGKTCVLRALRHPLWSRYTMAIVNLAPSSQATRWPLPFVTPTARLQRCPSPRLRPSPSSSVRGNKRDKRGVDYCATCSVAHELQSWADVSARRWSFRASSRNRTRRALFGAVERQRCADDPAS